MDKDARIKQLEERSMKLESRFAKLYYAVKAEMRELLLYREVQRDSKAIPEGWQERIVKLNLDLGLLKVRILRCRADLIEAQLATNLSGTEIPDAWPLDGDLSDDN